MASPAGSPPHLFGNYTMSGQSKSPEGIVSSSDPSEPGSAGGRPKEKKKRVGFGSGSDSGAATPRVSWIEPAVGTVSPKSISEYATPENRDHDTSNDSRNDSTDEMPQNVSKSHLPELSRQQTREIHEAFGQSMPVPKPRPAMRKGPPSHSNFANDYDEGPDEDGQRTHRKTRMHEAFERGKRLEHEERSEPTSRRNSLERRYGKRRAGTNTNDITSGNFVRKYDGNNDEDGLEMPTLKRSRALIRQEAYWLVRKHAKAHRQFSDDESAPGFRSGAVTPTEDQDYAEEYRPRPEQYRGGILGALMKLHDQARTHSRSSSTTNLFQRRHHSGDDSATPTPQQSPPESGTATPNRGSPLHWFNRGNKRDSRTSLGQLIGTSASLGTPLVGGLGEQVSQRLKEQKEQAHRPSLGPKAASSSALSALKGVTRSRRHEEEIKITIHIAETMARQRFLQRLCRALMQYGAPTHRLEEYMRMSARVLEIEAQFLYIPGSMIMSFDDPATHTTEVKLVKVAQGLDLGKLRDVHEIYKDVLHDQIGVDEATQRLKEVMGRKNKHSRWIRIPIYGLAAVSVGPFAFQARLIDLPIAFILGCILGILQLVIAPRSDLYANVFEVSAAVITSFLARAFGSIPYNGERLFCFSALAQSSIALILPGYIVLCASLELQARSIVAGSVRMVYAVIYSLFLGFGITIGTAIYGIIDDNASSETTCQNPLPNYWFFFFVPVFTMCLIIINQAKWKQAPVMLVIAFVGYLVNFFSSQRFAGNTQVSNTLGALTIGTIANLYSRVGSQMENWALDRWEHDLRPYWIKFRKRVFHMESKNKSEKRLEEGSGDDSESTYKRSTRRVGYSLAAAAMLPAIFVQVPSGLAAQGSLVSGIASANQIAGNATNGTQVISPTSLTTGTSEGNALNSIAFNVSYSVIQVAIGITVGLFLSSIIVYPLGKRRSGLFSL